MFCTKSVVPQSKIRPTNEKIIVYIANDKTLCALLLRGNLLNNEKPKKYY